MFFILILSKTNAIKCRLLWKKFFRTHLIYERALGFVRLEKQVTKPSARLY